MNITKRRFDIEKLLPGAGKNILLKNYTTFKIGGKAEYFFVAQKKEDLAKAIKLAKEFKLPFFILGGGSNILVADEGFKGLVVKLQIANCKLQNGKIYAEAGVSLAKLVRESLRNNLTGLEWAGGIPGTVGGAIYGNAGAFDRSMADVVKDVEIAENARVGPVQIRKFKNKECKFGYRYSIFKKNKNLIILSVELQLKKGNKKEIRKKMKEYLDYRKETQPLNFPSAGSIFKNPKGFLAAKIIEKCGLKGKKIGNVKISEKHSNFIVNLGAGKAKDVKKLIDLVKKEVKNRFGIELEEEICYLGFKN